MEKKDDKTKRAPSTDEEIAKVLEVEVQMRKSDWYID